MNTIYSASEGPMFPNKYIIEKSPVYPQIIETPPPQIQPVQPVAAAFERQAAGAGILRGDGGAQLHQQRVLPGGAECA